MASSRTPSPASPRAALLSQLSANIKAKISVVPSLSHVVLQASSDKLTSGSNTRKGINQRMLVAETKAPDGAYIFTFTYLMFGEKLEGTAPKFISYKVDRDGNVVGWQHVTSHDVKILQLVYPFDFYKQAEHNGERGRRFRTLIRYYFLEAGFVNFDELDPDPRRFVRLFTEIVKDFDRITHLHVKNKESFKRPPKGPYSKVQLDLDLPKMKLPRMKLTTGADEEKRPRGRPPKNAPKGPKAMRSIDDEDQEHDGEQVPRNYSTREPREDRSTPQPRQGGDESDGTHASAGDFEEGDSQYDQAEWDEEERSDHDETRMTNDSSEVSNRILEDLREKAAKTRNSVTPFKVPAIPVKPAPQASKGDVVKEDKPASEHSNSKCTPKSSAKSVAQSQSEPSKASSKSLTRSPASNRASTPTAKVVSKTADSATSMTNATSSTKMSNGPGTTAKSQGSAAATSTSQGTASTPTPQARASGRTAKPTPVTTISSAGASNPSGGKPNTDPHFKLVDYLREAKELEAQAAFIQTQLDRAKKRKRDLDDTIEQHVKHHKLDGAKDTVERLLDLGLIPEERGSSGADGPAFLWDDEYEYEEDLDFD